MYRRNRDRLCLILLLVGTYLLSAAWALATPVPSGANLASWSNFQPDESSHVYVIRYIADHHGSLPPYARPYDTSVHPPLYHEFAAVAYRLSAPVFGDAGALLAIRLLTVLSGVGTVYLTYRAARAIASRQVALFAGCLVALIPMRASLGGGITNENFAACGAAGVICVLAVGWADRRRGFMPWTRLLMLSLYLIVGVGSKVTCLGLIPIAFVSIVSEAWLRRRPIALAIAGAALVAVAPIAALGWWFERNRVLYGDFLRKGAADRLWDRIQPGFDALHRQTGISAAMYAKMLTTRSWISFWGAFDAFTQMMPLFTYVCIALFQAAAIAGLVRAGRSGWLRRRPHHIAFLVTAIAFTVFVEAVFYAFNWRHYSPQGRYFFVLLAPFGVLSALGWRAFASVLFLRARSATTVILLSLLLLLNLWCLWKSPRVHIENVRILSSRS